MRVVVTGRLKSRSYETKEGEKRTVGLESQTKFWATPTSSDNSNRGGKMAPSHGIVLAGQAGSWPTPSATVMNDGESPETFHARAALLKARHGNGNGAGLPLTVASVQWLTPATRDFKGTNSVDHMNRTDGRTDGRTEQEPCRPTSEFHHDALFAPGPSDPRWGAILAERPELAPAITKEAESLLRGMADGLADGLDFSDRAGRLRACGNGVVAGQAALAIVLLARRSGILNKQSTLLLSPPNGIL